MKIAVFTGLWIVYKGVSESFAHGQPKEELLELGALTLPLCAPCLVIFDRFWLEKAAMKQRLIAL
jgi:hypothetical protein